MRSRQLSRLNSVCTCCSSISFGDLIWIKLGYSAVETSEHLSIGAQEACLIRHFVENLAHAVCTTSFHTPLNHASYKSD